MSITEFIGARLDEIETIAQDWRHNRSKVEIHGGGTGYVDLVSPERTLAWVEAIRAVVALHEAFPYLMEPGGLWCESCGVKGGFWPCQTLRAIAAIWRDHERWQETWT